MRNILLGALLAAVVVLAVAASLGHAPVNAANPYAVGGTLKAPEMGAPHAGGHTALVVGLVAGAAVAVGVYVSAKVSRE
ncbi:MAG: hypothetical protein GSR80_000994 [Desulfurococcales archaeon]|nr:hypothetical protein [Desulfurococcales archaeon]